MVVLLAEDKRHQQLAYRIFRGRGFVERQITKLPLPVGGDAKAYVLGRVSSEVMAIRKRQASGFLIVILDADMDTVTIRIGQLNERLREADVDPVVPGNDCVEFWIPRRNVETWLCALLGVVCNEEEDYKNQFNHRHRTDLSGAIARAAQALIAGEADTPWPPSLTRVKHESRAVQARPR